MSDRTVQWAPLVAGAVVLAVLPWIFTSSFLRATLVRFTIALLLLTGLNFIAGYARMISLAQAGLFGVGAYTAAILATTYDVPPAVAFLMAPVVAVLVALPVGIPTLRLRGLYFVMATLGAGVVLFLLFGRLVGLTGGPNGRSRSERCLSATSCTCTTSARRWRSSAWWRHATCSVQEQAVPSWHLVSLNPLP